MKKDLLPNIEDFLVGYDLRDYEYRLGTLYFKGRPLNRIEIAIKLHALNRDAGWLRKFGDHMYTTLGDALMRRLRMFDEIRKFIEAENLRRIKENEEC